MRAPIFLTVIALISLTFLLSCKRGNNQEPETTTKEINGPFTAKINSVQFLTTNAGETYTPSIKILEITGVTKDNREPINLTNTRILNINVTG